MNRHQNFRNMLYDNKQLKNYVLLLGHLEAKMRKAVGLVILKGVVEMMVSNSISDYKL